MHIPDAVLSPSSALVTGVLGATGFAYCLRRVEREHGDRTVMLMGMTSAFVFAGQMLNFPVFWGVSGHLLGGVLAAVLLGPWAGAVTVGVVLIVQCFLFGDGGVTALGANFLNMGIVGSIGGYAIYEPIRKAIGGRSGIVLGAMLAAWVSVILASASFAIELSAGGRQGFLTVLGWMTLIHAAIGLGEAIITGLVIRYVLMARPDLIHDEAAAVRPAPAHWGRTALAGLGVALAVAVFLSPFACSWDDGLEHVGGRLGFLREDAPPLIRGLIPDYEWNLFSNRSLGLATALAGLVGTLVVFAVGLALARALARRDAAGTGPDAA